jgi:phosphonate transport system substrate-binding protein
MKPAACLRRRQLLAALAGLPALAGTTPVHAQAAGAAAPLSIVLSPFLSPASLLALYRPLREHLERTLQRPVEMFTAKDFRTLAEETRRGEHRVVQLPAHLARLAMLDWGCELLAAPEVPVTVVVGVKDKGPVLTVADLRGRSVGMLDALALTATVGRRWLEVQGLAAQVQVVPLASVNSALFALDRDEIAAFVAADTQLVILPAGTPRGERVLASIGGISGPMLLAGPALPAAERTLLRAALETYRPDPSQAPNSANSRQGPLSEARLKSLDVYAAIARQALAAPATAPASAPKV